MFNVAHQRLNQASECGGAQDENRTHDQVGERETALRQLNSSVAVHDVLGSSSETNNRNDTANWQSENRVQRSGAQLRTFV